MPVEHLVKISFCTNSCKYLNTELTKQSKNNIIIIQNRSTGNTHVDTN